MPINGDGSALNSSLIKPNYTINDITALTNVLPVKVNDQFRRSDKSDNKRYQLYKNRRITSLPDLENGNSNSSDGS